MYIEFTRHIQRSDFTFKLHFHLYKFSSKQSAQSVSNRRSQLREKFCLKYSAKYLKRVHFKERNEGTPSGVQYSSSTNKNKKIVLGNEFFIFLYFVKISLSNFKDNKFLKVEFFLFFMITLFLWG